MLTTRKLFGPIWIGLLLSISFVLAVLQNVTVDDAALTGSSLPMYMPSPSYWNQGDVCTGCVIQPAASEAYDGTWHDTTVYVRATFPHWFEFTFTGSGLYIFFILSNGGQPGDSFTNVTFILDGVQVHAFKYISHSNTNTFEYNQAVYASDSISYGQHTMQVLPVNDSMNDVLILFDYLIYTTEIDTTTSTAVSSTSSSGILDITTSSGQEIGAIVGGTVGGFCALVLAIASFLYYRRHRRRTNVPSFSGKLEVSSAIELVGRPGSNNNKDELQWDEVDSLPGLQYQKDDAMESITLLEYT